jgi:hypothetical protein
MSNTIYLNMKTSYGVETVDEFTRGEDSPQTPIEFRKYVRSMAAEYRLSGQNVYTSSRCTKEWKTK